MVAAYLICAILVVGICPRYLYKSNTYHNNVTWGLRRGCLPPELPKKWPLGIDRIKELWEANAEGRLLAYLCKIAEDYEPGNNLTQYLLFGPRAFHLLHSRIFRQFCPRTSRVSPTVFLEYCSTSSAYHFLWRVGRLRIWCEVYNFATLLGDGIFTQEGPAWKQSRELLRRQFIHLDRQDLNLFHEHVDNLMDRLPSNGIVDLQPLFFDLTLDTTTALLFGRSINSLRADHDQQKENTLFADSFNIAQEGLAKRFRIVPWHFLYNPPTFRKACANVHRFVKNYIKGLDLQNPQRHGLKQDIFIKKIAEESASLKELRDQILNILLAGRDTTACCLTWTFRLLIRHVNVMTTLRQEIASVMEGGRIPNKDQIRKMPYLACVIKESLRLYPPVPLNNREAVRTCLLPVGGGPHGDDPILVRKGELVVFSPYVSSRKKNIFGPDASEFRPERWQNDELENITWAYFPFSRGPWQCLGKNFAQMEISYTIIRILQSFSRIILPIGEPNDPVGSEKQRLTLVLLSAEGCKVEVHKERGVFL